jgi:hypothetical protein
MPLQIRRGTDAERLAMTQPLAQGELLYVTNAERLYIGNGATLGGVQITGYTNEDAQDAAALLFSNGAHTGITFAYNDASASISAVVDLSNYQGTIGATSFKGSIFADDSTLLVDAVSGTIVGPVVGNITGNVTGNVIGNLTGNITGNVTGDVTGSVVGDLKGSVFADDSTTLVDGPAGVLRGQLIGSLTGSVTGDIKGSIFADDSALLVDAIAGVITGDIVNSNITTNTFIGSSIIINGDPPTNGIAIYSEASLEDNVDIFNIITAHNDAAASGLVFTRSRGTIAAPTALTSNNEIFSLVFAGQSSTTAEPSVRLDIKLDGSVGTAIVPGKLAIATANSAGVMTDRLTIDSKGISTFAGMVQLPTFADETAANAAVTTPANGMMYYDSGASKVKARQGGAWVALT